jgi:hypothetical protein
MAPPPLLHAWNTDPDTRSPLGCGFDTQRAPEASDLLAHAEKTKATAVRPGCGLSVGIEADAAIGNVDFALLVGLAERYPRRPDIRVLEHIHDELADRTKDDGLGGVIERVGRAVVDDLELERVERLHGVGEPLERLPEA